MKPATELAHWMLDTGRTDVALSLEINSLKGSNTRINARQIGRWRKGHAQPRPWVLKILSDMSGGRVDANSFVKAMT